MTSPPVSGAPAPSDATDDQTGRFVRQPNGRVRPLSPHLQVWRWHITMAASIAFRVTVGAASAAAILGVGWLAVTAFGPEAYARMSDLMGSPLGLVVGFGLTVVLFSFILNGARHTFNDTGNGLSVGTSNILSHIAVWGSLVCAALFWVGLVMAGRIGG